MKWPHHRYALVLGVIFCAWFALLAWSPHDRSDWLLENALAVLLIGARMRRDFARTFVESLRVKHPAPLGEDALFREEREG